MSLKRYIAYPLIGLLLILFIGAGLFVLTDDFLPGFLETRILSILEKDAAISEITLNLRELGLSGADLGPLTLGSSENPALVVRSIQVDYSPWELYHRKVKKITASGVELHAEFNNGKMGLRGFDLAGLFNRLEAASPQNTSGDLSASFFPQHIEIKSATILFDINGQVHRIPFEIVAVKEGGAEPILNVLIDLHLREQVVRISALADLREKRLTAQLVAERLNLSRFADLFESVAGLRVAGTAELEIGSKFMLKPFSISDVHGQLKGSALSVGYGRFRFENLSDQQQNEKRMIIDFERSGGMDWRVKMSGFAAGTPLATRIADMTATVRPQDDRIEISGNFKLSFQSPAAGIGESGPIRFTKPFELPLQFSGRYSKSDSWHVDLAGPGPEKSEYSEVGFDYDAFHIATRSPEVSITGGSLGGKVSARYKLLVPNVRILSATGNIIFPKLVLIGETTIGSDDARSTTSTIALEISSPKLASNDLRMKANRLAAVCTLQSEAAGGPRVDGHVTFDGGQLTDTQGSFEFAKATGDIPLRFPAAISAEKGRVEIGSVRYQTLMVGSIRADLKQTTSGVSFGGNLQSRLMPALSVNFSGEMQAGVIEDTETRVHFEILYPETGPEIDLGKLVSVANGFSFKGKVIEVGDLVMGREGIRMATTTRIRDGILQHRRNKMSVEGIEMDLTIPELAKMRSAPGQQLKFTHASLGEMNIENAEIVFQIESMQSVLVEKSKFTWCDGKVEAPAIRFTSGIEDYNLILYCDRLDLDKVLQQFGTATEKAEGQLNGRIPLRYRNGVLSFTDGFLYTTPGESGKIRMTDTEMLTAGIPTDTPQYIQMELARKALEDYDYSWAKLNLTTEGDDLLLKMQLDGKPAKALPFVYQKDLGGFAKIEADGQGSTFQGIRLDVNFRLPLNKILQYKELIQMIQKNRE